MILYWDFSQTNWAFRIITSRMKLSTDVLQDIIYYFGVKKWGNEMMKTC